MLHRISVLRLRSATDENGGQTLVFWWRSVPVWCVPVCLLEVCPCLSPGGYVNVQGLCDAACRGLSRQVVRLESEGPSREGELGKATG